MLNKPKASARLRQAVEVGMVKILHGGNSKSAVIMAPPGAGGMSDNDWLDVIAAGSEVARELRSLGYDVDDSEPKSTRHPGAFASFCDRCKEYRADCLLVPYFPPPRLTPPETEFVIGPDYITERVLIDPEDMRMKHAAMCAECRAAKLLFASSRQD